MAAAPDGRFVVAWEDDPQGDGTYQVAMRGFAADGSERFASRSVHIDDLGHRIAPAVGLAADVLREVQMLFACAEKRVNRHAGTESVLIVEPEAKAGIPLR